VGRTFVKGGGKPMDILEKLNEMAGFAPNEEIQLFEEIKFEPNVMCEPVDKKFTFKASQVHRWKFYQRWEPTFPKLA
jgi:ubiquitin carboxyl-terminal hydrolase 7